MILRRGFGGRRLRCGAKGSFWVRLRCEAWAVPWPDFGPWGPWGAREDDLHFVTVMFARRVLVPVVALVALVAQPPAPGAQGRPNERPAPVLTESPVDGTSIRRMQAETVIAAPFESVSAQVLDYEHYPEFMLRFRSARVVRRNRAATDVYFQLELPRALGVVWFVHRMTVAARDGNRLEIVGDAQSGNVGRVETRVVVERIPGAARATRLTFALFGMPVVPALPDTVNSALRDAVRWASVLLQGRVERAAHLATTPR